ncbi:MAG: hypothetical protein VX005_08815 [Pseudomonadota bacterium]|nr:hypothetical protein [Pseudomonadota bacterium]
MKTVFSGIAALGLGLALVGCGSPTIGGQFAEPAYGWQRNGTYILTPTEMEMDCDGLVVEQGKAAKAIAYVDDVRGQRFGESLVISGVAAIFGLVRLPDMGFEERKAKEQLIQGAEAFNERLVELGCAPSDINALIEAETKKFREAQLEAEAAAEAKNPTTFTVGTKSSD